MSLLLLATSSRAADFDGNGADDLVIGIPAEDVGSGVDAGAVEVLYGFVGGPVVLWEDSFTQDSDLPGASQSGDELGMSFATGDFDGDGFDDLAMGVPGESLGSIAQAGMVIVMYGSVYGLDDTTAETWDQDTSGVLGTAEDFDMFGWTLAAGDFNGDGRDDLAVGSPFEAIGTLGEAGCVNVLYGSSGGLTSTGNQLWYQGSGLGGTAAADEWLGWALTAGDFDGDGRDDLGVGVPGQTVNGYAEAGEVDVVYGSSSGLTSSRTLQLSQNTSGVYDDAENSDHFGITLAAGDMTGDGRAELVVGVPDEDFYWGSWKSNWPAAGLVHVFRGGSSGLSGSSSREAWATWGQSRDAQLGFSLAMGDANGDGYADLFTGVPGTDEVVTWYGTSSSTTWSGVGHTYGTGYGDVLAAGDYDLDGLTDLAMGKPDYNSSTGVAGAGVVVVVGTFGGTRSFDQDSSGVSGVAQAYDGFGAALR